MIALIGRCAKNRTYVQNRMKRRNIKGHFNSQRDMLKEFNDYLTDQIGQPYVWGGQHTKLTPEN